MLCGSKRQVLIEETYREVLAVGREILRNRAMAAARSGAHGGCRLAAVTGKVALCHEQRTSRANAECGCRVCEDVNGATALNLKVADVKSSMSILDGISEAAADLLKDKAISPRQFARCDA